MNIITIVMTCIILGVITLIGIGVGYWFFLKLKPKKMVWTAKVYQIGDGVMPRLKKDGKVISEVRLKDLKPYTTDTLERIEKDKGIIIYKLQKLNRTTPEVTSNCVDYWGENHKEVSVLIEGENCTLLKKGYDVNSQVVFRPVPYDKVNMIINQMSIRKDRLEKDKNVLAEILPYITIVICMLTLIGLAWITGKAYVTMSENNRVSLETMNEALVKASENYKEGLLQYGAVQKPQIQLGIQEPPPPPSIE